MSVPASRDAARREYIQILEGLERIKETNKLALMYPDEGPYRRELYPKHMELIQTLGSKREAAFFGGNGAGKTTLGAHITTVLATGLYPDWWDDVGGPRFNGPVRIWVAGETKDDVRDITQAKLFGDVAKEGESAMGTGMIPKSCIERIKYTANTNHTVDFANVRHVSGRSSVIVVKSYEERRKGFQGQEQHFIWLDEEPSRDIYSECLMRGRKVQGKILLTFTPMLGRTELYEDFNNFEKANAQGASRGMVRCSSATVPHLTDQERREMFAGLRDWERAAREEGFAAAQGGMVYPVPESVYVVHEPKRIPDEWPRCFGFDGGFHNTAALWGAYEEESDTWHIYSEHKQGEIAIPMHASAIKARGSWIPGTGDAAATSQLDGKKILTQYRDEGIDLYLADKTVDAGIADVLTRLQSGRIKIWASCQMLREELRGYRYDENQKIVKVNDHLCDALRYLIRSGRKYMTTKLRKSIQFPEIAFG